MKCLISNLSFDIHIIAALFFYFVHLKTPKVAPEHKLGVHGPHFFQKLFFWALRGRLWRAKNYCNTGVLIRVNKMYHGLG